MIVELFQQVDAGEAFEATPAPLDRVERQLDLAAAYSTAGAIGFSIPEYMTPLGGTTAERLYESYRKRLLRATPD